MQLVGLRDSLDQLREKGFLSETQTAMILGQKDAPPPPQALETSALPRETALLCEQILQLNVRLERELGEARAAKNAHFARTIRKFKTALFLHALCGFLDRKIEQLRLATRPGEGEGPGLEFYEARRAQLGRLCGAVFPRFEFK